MGFRGWAYVFLAVCLLEGWGCRLGVEGTGECRSRVEACEVEFQVPSRGSWRLIKDTRYVEFEVPGAGLQAEGLESRLLIVVLGDWGG